MGTLFVHASTLTFVCGSGVDSATCDYLNSTIAGHYTGTFSNVNASFFVQLGSTGLASSTFSENDVSYSAYLAALNADPNKNALQLSALASLNANAAGPYGSGDVSLTAALASTLGFGGVQGFTSTKDPCSIGTAGCFDGVITMTNTPGIFYFDNLGGTEDPSQYDFYATVEHEVDELLGSASCITTATTPLSENCNSAGQPSAVDLFRYSGPGSLVLNSSLSAYFSYDGGVSNGANGALYNTLDNGDDYADFTNTCPSSAYRVQDAEGCPGTDAGLSILNDGGAELNILNAVGYDVAAASSVPEPSTWSMMALLGLFVGSKFTGRRARPECLPLNVSNRVASVSTGAKPSRL